MEFSHIPVLYEECIAGLNINPTGIYVDCTTGGGGHSKGIAGKLTTGRLICFDQDQEALSAAEKNLEEYKDHITFVKDNFVNIKQRLQALNINQIDGALLDIGVSSYQIDEQSRGFSYIHDGMLDMRMDTEQKKTARLVINEYNQDELSHIFWKFGEEKWSKRIAEFIVEAREEKPIERTLELVEIIEKAIPKKVRNKEKGHPAKRVFQALRIEVNEELNVIEKVIPDIVSLLRPKGRVGIITFHSLEDRIVKTQFKELAKGCICPKNFPICVCNHKPQIKIITGKPVLPTEKELLANSRSKSAKLRIAERLTD